MPPFCIATEAHSVGDFGSTSGTLSVDPEASKALARGVLDRGIDMTVSARMTVDHGCVQPLEMLFGGIDRVPVVPVYVNGVATPLGPMSRIRALGAAIGEAAAQFDKRVLFIGSGGLSHDPPVPVLEGAPPRVADALIEGTPPTPEQRSRGDQRIIEVARKYAAGDGSMRPINPEWDNTFLDVLENGALSDIDNWTVEWMTREAGGSSHEIRTWVAAFSALAATGEYRMESRFYEPIPEWIAGFAVAAAARA